MPNESFSLTLPATRDEPVLRDRRVAVLSIVFVISGFCGLIYESIWSHYLKLFVGHAAYAQTVVLVVFIGGMAIGAALIGRIAQRIRAPLLAYAVVEVVIGLISLVFHSGFVASTEWAYTTLLPATCAPESPCLSQWGLAAALILPQSVLLGMTFPLMTAGILRLVPRNPGASIALFYFLNSIGAVAGVLSAAFVLIPKVGLPGALFTAGLLNIGVALAAWLCSRGTVRTVSGTATATSAADDTSSFRRLLLLVAALTGLSSFIYEIAWIRMLSLVIGASTDAFELMLAAFILGLALGGLWVRKHIDRFRDLIVTLAIVQVLMGVAAVLTVPLYSLTFDLFAWLMRSLNRSTEGYALYNIASHGIALIVMLPATFLAGMTLPLITTALLRGRQGEGAIGFVYAANTLGAIVGVILAVHFVLPVLGLKGALVFGAAIDIALAIALLAFRSDFSPRRHMWAWWAAGFAVLLGVAFTDPLSEQRMASGVYRHGVATLPDTIRIISHKVGKTANVAVVDSGENLSIRTNGKSDAAIAPADKPPTSDEYTMGFTAVLPLALRPRAEHAAVIGFGSGMTTHTLLGSPYLKRVDTIEIEPQMVEGARHFGGLVERAYTDPRSRIVIDDAKSYFARSPLRYDLIVSEPSNPWVSGVSSLFTSEFYSRVKRQLTDDGLFVQWLQAYEFSNALLGTVLRAIDSEFADYAIYAANDGDMMIVAAKRELPVVTDEFTRFGELKPLLHRISMATVDEIELRRLAGASTVRALISATGTGINSDYYPLVDHGAPRERFLRSKARMLLELQSLPVPLVEMLETRLPTFPENIAFTRAYHERRDSLHTANVSAEYLVSGATPDEAVPMPRDIGLLRAIVWNCVALPPRVRLRDLMYDIAIVVNPQLSRERAATVWAAIRSAPCATAMTADDRAWLDLFDSVGARDADRMAALGIQLANGAGHLGNEMRRYAVIAGATGLAASDRSSLAAEFLQNAIPQLPAHMREDPAMLVLRGYVQRRVRVRS